MIFDISLADYEVTSVFEKLGYVTVADPFYTATTTSVELVSVVPEPAGATMLRLAGGLLTTARRPLAGDGKRGGRKQGWRYPPGR